MPNSPRTLFVVLFLLLSAPARTAEPLIVAAPEGPPNTFWRDGRLTGLMVDLVREAFRRAGQPIEFRILPWPRCIEDVRFGHADAMFVVYRTADRLRYFDYSTEVLAILREHLYVRHGHALTAPFDGDYLRRHRIGVVNRTWHGERMEALLADADPANVTMVAGYENLARLLAADRIDVALAASDSMNGALAELRLQTEVDEVEPEIEAIPSYLVFTRKRDLGGARQAFDAALRDMKKDGSYGEIVARYGRDRQP